MSVPCPSRYLTVTHDPLPVCSVLVVRLRGSKFPEGKGREMAGQAAGKRCHACLRKITAENPSSSVDRWGNECCDTCTTCTHGVPLIVPFCGGCATLFLV